MIKEKRPRYKKSGSGTDIPEHLLARLWQRRAARQAWFQSQGGPKVRVLYPGRASHAAGPDFRNALLEVEGMGLVQGDVEIHVRQQDWSSHGHGQDPRYNGVVLHAALEVQSPSTELQSGQSAPVISLAPLLDVPVEAGNRSGQVLWDILARHGYPRPHRASAIGDLLDRAGDQRFLAKSRQFQGFLQEQGPDQTLYEGLMEGLGYHQNQHPFILLAQRASYQTVAVAALRLPVEQRAQCIEAWLIQVSGLLSKPLIGETSFKPAGKPPGTPPGLGPPLDRRAWHCFRVRPANHPLRRIAGAAGLLARFLEPGLVAGLGEAADTRSTKKLASALTVVGGRSSGAATVGQGRARDLAVNVVLPFLHALAVKACHPGAGEAHLDLYRRFPKLQENELTREMARQLLPPAWRPEVKGARRQQGLLHLHQLLSGVS